MQSHHTELDEIIADLEKLKQTAARLKAKLDGFHQPAQIEKNVRTAVQKKLADRKIKLKNKAA